MVFYCKKYNVYRYTLIIINCIPALSCVCGRFRESIQGIQSVQPWLLFGPRRHLKPSEKISEVNLILKNTKSSVCGKIRIKVQFKLALNLAINPAKTQGIIYN